MFPMLYHCSTLTRFAANGAASASCPGHTGARKIVRTCSVENLLGPVRSGWLGSRLRDPSHRDRISEVFDRAARTPFYPHRWSMHELLSHRAPPTLGGSQASWTTSQAEESSAKPCGGVTTVKCGATVRFLGSKYPTVFPSPPECSDNLLSRLRPGAVWPRQVLRLVRLFPKVCETARVRPSLTQGHRVTFSGPPRHFFLSF